MRGIIFAVIIGLFPVMEAFAQGIEYIGSTSWSYITDIEVIGDYAYCSFMNGLVILDVSNPANPTLLSKEYCQGSSWGIDVDGN